MPKYIVGVDISKATFDVAILLPNNKIKHKKFENQDPGFIAFMDWCKSLEALDLQVCMEATGSYGEALAIYLFDQGCTVSVVNPFQIKSFGQSGLVRTKNDRTDAKLIARFCQAMSPKAWKPAPKSTRDLQSLVRRLEALQSMHQQESNRLEPASSVVKASIEAVMEKLSEEISSVKKLIADHIDSHPDLHHKSKLLDSIPGVGEATITQVLAFFGNPEDFKTAKQVSAFIGLNPKQRQSGTSVLGRSRLSKMGNSDLRKSLYFPAICAKNHNPVIKAFCERLKKAGKPVMVIIGAAMRKLVHIIYGVLKSGKPFDASLAAHG